MKKAALLFVTSSIFWSALSFASPLIDQWVGKGADADKIFCKYGDGEVKVISGNQNCPMSN